MAGASLTCNSNATMLEQSVAFILSTLAYTTWKPSTVLINASAGAIAGVPARAWAKVM